MITVIIPFYQKTPGILARALLSVARQTTPCDEVIVVDDGSPVSARSEVDGITEPLRFTIKVRRQANAGAGAARSAGLASLDPSCSIVAFLDSDDTWNEGHLARCKLAIEELHADCFWGALAQDDRFQMSKNFIENSELDFKSVPDQRDFFALPSLQRALLTDWGQYFHLSGLAIARTLFDVRFDKELRHASEDFMYFFRCALHDPKVIVSTRPSVQRGVGDNLFHNTAWGSAKALRQMRDEFKVWRFIVKHGRFDQAKDRTQLTGRLEEYRDKAIGCTRAGLRKRRLDVAAQFARLVVENPSILKTMLRRGYRWTQRRAASEIRQ